MRYRLLLLFAVLMPLACCRADEPPERQQILQLLGEGKNAEALTAARDWTTAHPGSHEALVMYATVQEACGDIDGAIGREFCRSEAVDIEDAIAIAQGCFDALPLLARQAALGGEPAGDAFEARTNFIGIQNGLQRKLAHDETAIALVIDETFGRQGVQGRAGRRARHAEIAREMHFVDATPGRQHAAEDGVTHPIGSRERARLRICLDLVSGT